MVCSIHLPQEWSAQGWSRWRAPQAKAKKQWQDKRRRAEEEPVVREAKRASQCPNYEIRADNTCDICGGCCTETLCEARQGPEHAWMPPRRSLDASEKKLGCLCEETKFLSWWAPNAMHASLVARGG